MTVSQILIFTLGCWLLGLAGAAVRAWRQRRRDELGPEFEGATVDSPPLAELAPPLPMEFDLPPGDQHHHRPAAAETDTHRLEMPR